MRPLPALLVALLFVVATVVPVAGIHQPPARTDTAEPPLPSITSVDNTTNQLSIPDGEVSQATYDTTGVDIGTATEVWSTQLHHRHDAVAFEDRYRRADSATARTRLIVDRISAIEDRQRALDRQQNRAISQYADGEISAQQFLRTRLVVDAEANELVQSLDRVSAVPNTVPEYTLQDSMAVRLRTTEGELRALTGPLGDRLQSSVTQADSRPLYLEVSPEAYMLATVADDQYVRETRLGSARDPDSPDEVQSDPIALNSADSTYAVEFPNDVSATAFRLRIELDTGTVAGSPTVDRIDLETV